MHKPAHLWRLDSRTGKPSGGLSVVGSVKEGGVKAARLAGKNKMSYVSKFRRV